MPRRAVESSGKRVALNMKTTEELRQRLEGRAAQSGRSLTAEVEYWLDAIDRVQPLLDVLTGGGVAAEFVGAVAKPVAQVRKYAQRKGMSEEDTRRAIRGAVDCIASCYLYTGGELPSPPDDQSAALGHKAAEDHMIWTDDPMQEDAVSYLVRNHWTGDGKEVRQTRDDLPPEGNAPGTPSLKEIMGR